MVPTRGKHSELIFAFGDAADGVGKFALRSADPDARRRLGEEAMTEIRERFNLNRTTALLNAALPKLLE